MLSALYRFATDFGAPFIRLYLFKRRLAGREDKARFAERLGRAAIPRPRGRLIWCHAASVGEAASILALIEKLRALYPQTHILITSGTVTSARMLGERLPAGAFHQYVPVDRAPYVERFLDHWKPDFVLLIESELWPNMLRALRRRAIPAALIQARMSDGSFQRWYRVKNWAKEMMGAFVLCLAQTEDDRARFVALGARPARCFGNLKYAAKPLPAETEELARLKAAIGDRPLWLLASSHRGEEEMVLPTHQKLREKYRDLLLIAVPRHAGRGEEIARMLKERGVVFARRSKKEILTPRTEVYLADTMGELGLFYRLCDLAVLGGSFKPVGGHNPIEPAQLDCAIIFGPYMHNFSTVAQEFTRQHAAIQLQGANELGFALQRLLAAKGERLKYAAAARMLADQKRHVLEKIVEALRPWLDPKSEEISGPDQSRIPSYAGGAR
jgi:3-deoxy-D-manno-octulosonic-acid transferase